MAFYLKNVNFASVPLRQDKTKSNKTYSPLQNKILCSGYENTLKHKTKKLEFETPDTNAPSFLKNTGRMYSNF